MRRIDTFPTHQMGELSYRAGQVFPFGASLMEDGVNFSVYSKDATGCTLVLYHHSQPDPFAEIPFPKSFRIGNVFTMLVFGLNIDTVEYGYRFSGPWKPEASSSRDSRITESGEAFVPARSVMLLTGKPADAEGSGARRSSPN